MRSKSTDDVRENRHRWLILPAAVLIAGALGAWWLAVRADCEMRQDLLAKTRLVAKAINVKHIKSLSGTEADLTSPVYLRLKEQLVAIRAIDPQCRFIYLMGQKPSQPTATNVAQPNNSIFFFVDSEPAGSKDESPAGQDYKEAPDNLRRVFCNQTAAVERINDRWGTWVTALVPIHDPASVRSNIATPTEALALVRKAIEYGYTHGRERLLREINNPHGKFRKDDLYAFAYDHNATMMASPVRLELVGKNLLDKKDWVGGKYFHREIRDLALSRGGGWVDYEYLNPISKAIESKTTYAKRFGDLIICAGAYRGTGNIVAVLGMDIDARNWRWVVAARSVLPAGLATFALLVILFVGSFLLNYRARLAAPPPRWMGHLEPVLTVAVGLVLTLFVAWLDQNGAHQNQTDSFRHLAESRNTALTEAFRDLRDMQLEGLARYYEGSKNVTNKEFRHYVGHLTENRAGTSLGVGSGGVRIRKRTLLNRRHGRQGWTASKSGKKTPQANAYPP